MFSNEKISISNCVVFLYFYTSSQHQFGPFLDCHVTALLNKQNHDYSLTLRQIMDMAHGGELFERLQDGPLDETSAVLVAKKILLAVAHVHEKGIMHRDIKPENILIRSPGDTDILLADFGLALKADRADDVVGSLQYMAPEVRDLCWQHQKSFCWLYQHSDYVSPGGQWAIHQGGGYVECRCRSLHHVTRLSSFLGQACV